MTAQYVIKANSCYCIQLWVIFFNFSTYSDDAYKDGGSSEVNISFKNCCSTFTE